MSNIMNQVDVKNNAHRNGFDLSHKIAFTSQSGMLLPIFSQSVLPGDSFNVSVSSFTRTQPVNTAAYTRIKEYFDWYFVPLHLLWSRAPQCIAQTNDLQQWYKVAVPFTSDGNLSVPVSFPKVAIHNITDVLDSINKPNTLEPYFGFNAIHGACRLLEHLGYGFRETKDGDSFGYLKPIETYVNLWRLCAYQKIYSDWFRFSQWETTEPWTFNLDYYDETSDFYSAWKNTCSPMLDGKSSMFTLRFCPWHKDMFTGVLPSQQFGNAAAIDIDISVDSPVSLKNPSDGKYVITTNPDTYSRFIGIPINEISHPVHSNSFPLNNFTQLEASPSAGYEMQKSNVEKSLYLYARLNDSTGFTVLQLRMAEAQQKWAEITQSGRLDYKSQMQKHFGVSPDDGLAHRSEYLGGTSGVLDINEVVNSNLTGDADANLAGKGVGSMQGHIKFTAREHGILMCIYHNEPLLDYGSNVFDKQVQEVSPSDMPIPEFDSIGMDSIYLHQLTGGLPQASWTVDTILGYVPRYIHYKTCVDRVLGTFNNTLSSWVTPLSQQYLFDLLFAGQTPSTWKMKLGFFYVNPAILNPIFGLNADLSSNTDQFLHNVFFDIKAARNLDRNGLPY